MQSWRAANQRGLSGRAGLRDTYNFSRSKIGTPPSGSVGGTTVVTLPPDTVCELGGGIVSVANQIIGRRLIVLGLVRGPEILHWAGRDRVGGGRVRIGGRVRLRVSGAIVMGRGRLVVEAVCFRSGVSRLHYDLIWVGGRGVKVPRRLGRELKRGGEKERERTRLSGTYLGRRGRPGRAIRSQRRVRFLKLNLGGRELDAFVRPVLPLDGRGKKEKEEGWWGEKYLWKESERCLVGSRETETFMLIRCCCW